jgi:GAF domain-containing protein
MRPTTSGAAFAAANAAMVQGVDGASTVHVLLADCLGLLGADTAGVLVRAGDHGLDLLAATSHKTQELELYQAQLHDGPCVESIETGTTVGASGEGDLDRRWPEFGRAMSAAGFTAVHACPMRWHGRVLGGLNLFWATTRTLTQEEHALAQAFADIATLALMQSPTADDAATITTRLRAALRGRVVIERAKGVLAHTEQIEMDEAFALLVTRSEEADRPLSEIAQQILDEIVAPRG